jgi:hypothetical protein
MSDNGIPEAREQIHLATPSAAPAFVALGLTLLVVGIYANGFLLPGWVYSVAGAIFFLFAVRSWVATARRDIVELPREQRVRSAVLPPVQR